MNFQFLFKKKRQKALDEKERAASTTHKKNIKNIVQSRQNANKLKEALEQNNVIIQIAGAIGHH